MNTHEEQRERLEREVRARKARMRSASLPAPASASGADDGPSPQQYVVNKVAANPGAAAAIAFGVMSVFGPWRSIRLAGKALGAAALVKKLTK